MIRNIPSQEYKDAGNFFTESASCQAVLTLFAQCSNASMAVFDEHGQQVSPLYGEMEFCIKFAKPGNIDDIPKYCLRFHKELFSHVKDKKKSRIMKCPLGLYCFAIPILIDNNMVAVISGGHILSSYPKDEYLVKLIDQFGIDKASFLESYRNIPVLSKKEIETAVERLSNAVRICFKESYDSFQSSRQLRKLIFASKINEMANTKLKLDELLERTTSEIVEAIEVDICLILLWDNERKDFSLWATNVKLPEKEAEMKFRMGEGVTGIVASTGKPVIIKDATKDPRVVKKSLGIKSLLAVPLKVGEESIGVLHVGTLKKFKDYTIKEIEFVEALASEVALVLNNAKLNEESIRKTEELKRSKQELQTYFSQIGTALSSALNLDQLLRMIVEISLKLIDSDAASLYMIEDRKLSTQISIGLEKDNTQLAKFRVRESLLGWNHNISAVQPEIIQSTEFLHQHNYARDSLRSYLGIPLLIKDEIIGLLNIYSKIDKEFKPDKIELLMAFAGQAAMAIDNAMNYEKEQRRAKEATLLYEAARAIGQSIDMYEILFITVEKLVKILQIDRCLIFLLDENNDEFYTACHKGLSEDQREFFSCFKILTSQISLDIWEDLIKGKPRIFSSVPPECPAFEKLFNLLPTNTCLIVPLIAREKLFGIIYLDNTSAAHNFLDSQIRQVMTLSIQIATALQRSRLISKQEENTNQLKALLQVSSVLPSSLSLPKVFNLVVEKAAQLVSKPAVALLIMDDEDNDFNLEASMGLDGKMLESDLQKLIAIPAVDKKRPITLTFDEEPVDEIGKSLFKCGFGGVLSIPLIAKRRLVGVLNCFSDIGYQFSFEETRLLKSFANHAAIAVENARLHAIVRNKVRELATLFEVGKAITSTLQFSQVMEEIAKNIRKAVNADACSIMLLDEEQKELIIQTAIGMGKGHFGQRIKLGEGVAGIAAKTGRPMILIDLPVKKVQYKFPKSIREEGLKTILSVPLESKGRIIGLINIYLKEIYYYKPNEISLLVALSKQAAIAVENARLYEAQYSVAQILQSIVMPQKEYVFSGIEVGYHYISSLELSGDYFDLIPLSETRFALVIADVSGKGPPAAIYTVRAKYILMSYAIAGYQPREILSMVNNLIVPETGGDKFISLFYMEVDLKKKLIKYSSAGHEPPIYCNQRTRELKLLETEGLLIGVNYDAKFRQEEMSIEDGDVLVLYTDGITEARGLKNEFFGLERMMEIVRKHANLDPQTISNRIYTAVQKYTRRKLNDDFSLLVVKV